MYAVFGHSAELHMISWTKATTLLLIWGTWKTWKTSQSGSDYWSEALGYASLHAHQVPLTCTLRSRELYG